jgi:hypothetical protein
MKKILSILLVLFFAVTAVWAQKKDKAANKKAGFYLEYTSSNKTITIDGINITVQEWIEQYDNPVSSTPSSRKEVVKNSTVTVSQTNELKEMIKKKGGFMSLPKNEYGASASERFYPYTITVNVNGKKKKVLYRSNPAPETEKCPKAFSDLEKLVNQLADSIKN